jgi:hypothetical protein
MNDSVVVLMRRQVSKNETTRRGAPIGLAAGAENVSARIRLSTEYVSARRAARDPPAVRGVQYAPRMSSRTSDERVRYLIIRRLLAAILLLIAGVVSFLFTVSLPD